jgi:membrane-associated phospholipid phosphatase
MAVILLVAAVCGSAGFRRTATCCLFSFALADQLKNALKWVFGRPFPETYLNPAYNSYEFHWFTGHGAFAAFPSGHMAAAASIISVLWIADGRWRALYLLAALAVGVGLVAADFHFLSDVIAGAFLGAGVGRFTAGMFSIAGAGGKTACGK